MNQSLVPFIISGATGFLRGLETSTSTSLRALSSVSGIRALSSGAAPSSSTSTEIRQPAGTSPNEPFDREKTVRRMLYRSKQRGWLELDLLVGLWAQENVRKLPDDLLIAFDQFLTEENPEMFKYLTGQLEPPVEMTGNPAFAALKVHVDRNLLAKRNALAITHPSKEWVRGWNDGAATQLHPTKKGT